MNNAKMVKENLYWVGSLDKDIKVFDVIMHTKYGTTYNSYIYKTSEKTILIEIAKEGFFDEFIERVKTVCDPSDIDIVIVNHTEPDHTGSLHKLLNLNPNLKVIGSNAAINNLKKITNMDFLSEVVNDNSSLDIGDGKYLKFISAPFLHWPDTMFTYSPIDKILFTCDFLGCHFCSENLYVDELTKNSDFMDAYKYYFDCIMSPFKNFVLNAIEKIKDLDIDVICNGHGPLIRKEINKYIDLYKKWSTPEKNVKPQIIIAYVSCYGYTKFLAERIEETIKSSDKADVKIYNLQDENIDNVIYEIEKANGLLIGSPTVVGDTLPPVWELLSKLNPFINKGLIVGAFGSYGWSGEAVPNIEQRFKQLKLKNPIENFKVLFNPTEDDFKKASDFAQKFINEIKI